MKGIFLLLGSNLGDRMQNMQRAKDILAAHEINISDFSAVYESAPWGDENQGWFLNMVLKIDTIHDPESLLQSCLDTEIQMGRTRLKKWGERIIDVDILYYHDVVIESPHLRIPHPGIAMRRFTLMPLVELAPHEIHPVLKLPQKQLLEICPDMLECHKTDLYLHI
ncbi:2-amino-4-hydroxy-6-hydroxymethyldihydropteridine diphosphokinase [Marinoscillum sp. 108]|uniref:2-amino-4-hydroxy-6- hydroxymethyldihydropteridine diphosphokinase n=1 Tax=Marinoscillum sp. 108 TaxID=2653151 RepID=UPI0012F2883D|nr:2-amino-4-hydroxy-6-hydroxymethyldihydropteridine diphosphokinase [Marinoscillum sp. 108]VXD10686.1 2-amino-4-hydroxy-6-hydroxymethyldihydropteridinediphosphokinase [Marinoscillum sp. 108]